MLITDFVGFGSRLNVDDIKIVCCIGPSGSGKTTTVRLLRERRPSIQIIPSITTRQPRESDLPGEYFYIPAGEFQRREQAGEFAWTVEASIRRDKYGTLKTSVREAMEHPSLSIIFLTPEKVLPLTRITGREMVLCLYFSPLSQVRRRVILDARGDTENTIEARFREEEHWLQFIQGSPIEFLQVPFKWKPQKKAREISHLLLKTQQS